MDMRWVEVSDGGNWGKFAVGRYSDQEWERRSRVDGRRLVAGRGWSREHVWLLDLATGEGATFCIQAGGIARFDVARRQIWVCPLFAPFLAWLYEHRRADPDGWFDTIPEMIEMPQGWWVLHNGLGGGGGRGDGDAMRRLLELTAWLEPVLRRVKIMIGPNSAAIIGDGGHLTLSGGEINALAMSAAQVILGMPTLRPPIRCNALQTGREP